eukprot:5054557-Amphidinium_carterae.1
MIRKSWKSQQRNDGSTTVCEEYSRTLCALFALPNIDHIVIWRNFMGMTVTHQIRWVRWLVEPLQRIPEDCHLRTLPTLCLLRWGCLILSVRLLADGQALGTGHMNKKVIFEHRDGICVTDKVGTRCTNIRTGACNI